MHRTSLLIVTLAMAMFIVACGQGASRRVIVDADTRNTFPVTTPTSDRSRTTGLSAAQRPSPWFVGEWSAHTLGFVVDTTGRGVLGWRTYRNCGQDPPPCDTWRGNDIIDGGHAVIALAATSSTTASGRVLSSSDPADLPIGPITMRFDGQRDVIYTEPSLRPVLCGPHAPVEMCG